MDDGDDGKDPEGTVFARILRALPPRIDRATVTRGTSLRGDLGLDSLHLSSFLLRCGDELGVDENDLIEALSMVRVDTLGDVVAACVGLSTGAAERSPGR
jgi:acyl carrier protein